MALSYVTGCQGRSVVGCHRDFLRIHPPCACNNIGHHLATDPAGITLIVVSVADRNASV